MRADDVPVFLAAPDQQELAVEERVCRDRGFERVAAAVEADRAARDELAGLTLALGNAAQHQELGQFEARGVEPALLDFARGACSNASASASRERFPMSPVNSARVVASACARAVVPCKSSVTSAASARCAARSPGFCACCSQSSVILECSSSVNVFR